MPNKYLNQEAFQELVSVIKERVVKSDQESLSDLQAVVDCVNACGNYVQAVIRFEAQISSASALCDVTQAAEIYQAEDLARHNAHEAAIIHVRVLNRLCDAYNVERIYIGDISNRFQVADFCGELTNTVFQNRK